MSQIGMRIAALAVEHVNPLSRVWDRVAGWIGEALSSNDGPEDATVHFEPSERADLPTFGCGLRQLLFAPNSDALQSTTQLLVQQSLNTWLGNQIKLLKVTVTPGPGGDYSQVLVQIEYLLLETQSQQQTQVLVS